MSKSGNHPHPWLEYMSVGLMFPVSIAVGLTIGYFLDRWLKTEPWLLMIFTLYGVGAGFYNVYKVTRKEDDHES